MDIEEVKRDRDMLLASLQQTETGQHLHCPFHGEDKTGSLSIWEQKGTWFWKCHAGCGSGTIIDATMKARGLSTPKQAVRALAEDMGEQMHEPAPPPPVIQTTRAERFVAWAHQQLLDRLDWQEQWVVGARGIVNMDVIRDLRVGFVEGCEIGGWSWRIGAGWVLPITDACGQLKAVKIHHEKKDRYDLPKCFWMPFGTEPKKNAWQTLWPAPERYGAIDEICLCPGELKAMAILAGGQPATSVTHGEANPVPDGLLMRLKARKVAICYDPDETGEKWKDKLYKQLSALGFCVGAFTYQPKPEQPPLPQEPEADLVPATESDMDALFGPVIAPADTDEVKALRQLCGDGDPRYWLAPGLSKASLEAFSIVAGHVGRENEERSAGATINDRDFMTGPYRQPKRITIYHERKRAV